jgi:glycosyltransferase involved in cell wall biosynthesis
MRILIILHQFYPEFCGGTERVALNLAKAAQRAGHYVHVLACTVNPAVSSTRPCGQLAGALETVHEGVPVTLLPRALLPAAADFSFETDPALVGRLIAWIEHSRFDCAHVLHPMRMGSALLAAQRSGLPYLLTLTDFFSPCFRINLVDTQGQLCQGPRAGTRCADACVTAPWTSESLLGRYRQARGILAAAGARICPSEYVAGRYLSAFPDLEFSTVPHGIDLLALAACSVSQASPPETGLTLGFIGSVVPQKGLDTLLRAFARVPGSSHKLRIVGGFYGDPAYHREVRLLAGADPRVEVVGEVAPAQVFNIIQSLDVLCLPSLVPETFSLVLHEAAAAGVPALVSDLGAPGERVAQLGGGRVLPPGDVDAWTRAIAEVAAHPELLETWRAELPLPLRIEEEAFFYESLYRRLLQLT